MNKHLNNWLDKVEGLPKNTSNKNILKEIARQLGSKGGRKSVKVRFAGKTKEQKSELMRKVRLGKESIEDKKNLIKHLKETGQIQSSKSCPVSSK